MSLGYMDLKRTSSVLYTGGLYTAYLFYCKTKEVSYLHFSVAMDSGQALPPVAVSRFSGYGFNYVVPTTMIQYPVSSQRKCSGQIKASR